MITNGHDAELDEVQAGIEENIQLGYIELAGTDADGQPTYRMTEAGIRHVEQMLPADDEEADMRAQLGAAETEVDRLRAELDAAPAGRYELPRAVLAAIDNALLHGSYMTGANLAFDLLCERLGVEREALVFDPLWMRHNTGPLSTTPPAGTEAP